MNEEPTPLVSVITATFNDLPGLRRTVDSVAGQSMSDMEHIVIDGGSTDGTRSYLETVGDDLRWISEPDEGIADALNKGVMLARGAYVLVLQANDVFVGPESLAAAARYLDGRYDIVACDILFGERQHARRLRTRFPRLRLALKPLHHQGVFARRALFAQVGNFDRSFRVHLDYDFLMRARRAGAQFTAIPVLLSVMADGGVSSQRDWPSLERRFAEERRVHFAHCSNLTMRIVYACYWPPYLVYRRLRSLLRRTASHE